MPWTRADDTSFYSAAERLQHQLGVGWVVLWGPGSRRFWAFACAGSAPLILSDPTLEGLRQQVRNVGHRQTRRTYAATHTTQTAQLTQPPDNR
ncbi:hypothetical protein [Nocardiopsis ganjiahuensis]|uniref:hypothetical protein n=1 Tax=Nocardiopsis ganjiahuensis TaxID=239984 RepID=UPI000376B84C|nr:hypothetical protein [Nocardiopsis ganjiahuensis]